MEEYSLYCRFFDKNRAEDAYYDDEEWLQDQFGLLEASFFALFQWKELEEAEHADPEVIDDIRELMIQEFEKIDRHMGNRMRETVREEVSLGIWKLEQRFLFHPFHTFCLILSMAGDRSRKLREAIAHLSSGRRGQEATVELGAQLYRFAHTLDAGEVNRLMAEQHPFWCCVRWKRDQAYEVPVSRREFFIKPEVAAYLYGEPLAYENLKKDSCFFHWEEELEEMLIYKNQWEEALAIIRRMEGQDNKTAWMMHLQGKKGCGKQWLIRHLAKECRRDLIFVFCREWKGKSLSEQQDRLDALRLQQAMTGAWICLTEFEGGQEEQEVWMMKLLSYLEDMKCLFFTTTCLNRQLAALWNKLMITIECPMPKASEKILLWEHFLRKYPVAEDVDASLYGNQYVLNAGEIKDVLETALLSCWGKKEEKIGGAHIIAAIKQKNRNHLGTYATLIQTTFTWEDLVVEPMVKRQMELICGQLKYRSVVGEEWNFYAKTPYGRGVCALFYGPPGTGKTMAVQVIANELSLDLYRIDLSQMISKYIGETQKNISELFEKAKEINALLFFDEADALFSKRSEVQDANDRNANAETAHLLQKLEEYEGITILATNLKDNLDDAFKRRIKFMVDFQFPEKETRRILWKALIPREAPLESDVDLEFLADRFELSGSAIKEILLNSAYIAAAEQSPIGNRHLIEAVKMNFAKYGKLLMNEDFGYLR